jgi:TRL (tRNA-associated locus)-like protein
MKKNLKTFGTILIVLLFLTSCELTRPVAATSNPVGSKRGESTALGILMFPPFVGTGNAGIEKAAKNGGITKISTVDFTNTYYIIFRTWTCTVTGE